jgi:putative tricarboxylic transport membrane protein
MLLLLNLPLVGLWVRLLSIPRRLLYAGILTLASLGAYSVNRSPFHVALTYGIGAAGFAMRRLSMPLAPAVIGLILGPLAEQQLRRSLAIGGSPMILFTRPISAALLLFAVGLIVATVIRPRFKTDSRS